MSSAAELHSQIASIVEVLANSAVAEICKAVEDGYAVLNLEMSRSVKENECLRRRVRLLELQVSRYRAEQRLKTPQEGAAAGRALPGVRLLHHHRTGRDTPTGTGSILLNRSRFLNKSSSSSQPQQKTTDLDKDPDQEVVTTTKTEPTETEENSDLVIVKVEGSVSIAEPINNNNNNSNNNTPTAPTARTSDLHTQTSVQKEVSGSQTFNKTQVGTAQAKTHYKNPTGALDSDVIVIDGGFVSGKDEIRSENATSNRQNYVENSWLSFQTPQSSNPSTLSQTSATSSQNAALSFTKDYAATVSQQQSTSFQLNVEALNQSLSAGRLTPSQGGFGGATARIFSCSKCPMRFPRQEELSKHLAGHRRRKYLCALCGKGFVCKSQLEIHQNVHTGERPFRCLLCNSGFSHPSNLRRHMRLQHQQQLNNGTENS